MAKIAGGISTRWYLTSKAKLRFYVMWMGTASQKWFIWAMGRSVTLSPILPIRLEHGPFTTFPKKATPLRTALAWAISMATTGNISGIVLSLILMLASTIWAVNSVGLVITAFQPPARSEGQVPILSLTFSLVQIQSIPWRQSMV
jgi:hypothetical protein